MILVTVGTTLIFDELIKAVDQMVSDGVINAQVICQIGAGNYVPKNCAHSRYIPSKELQKLIERADLVIGHGGTGTVLSLLAAGKKFIAVANPHGADDHQAQFLEKISGAVNILWTRNPGDLPGLIEKSREHQLGANKGLRLADEIRQYLLTP